MSDICRSRYEPDAYPDMPLQNSEMFELRGRPGVSCGRTPDAPLAAAVLRARLVESVLRSLGANGSPTTPRYGGYMDSPALLPTFVYPTLSFH
jgi:hypothetical protein